jgi:hypothetical protein
VLERINGLFGALEIMLLRSAALALLAIYLYKLIRKHWRAP